MPAGRRSPCQPEIPLPSAAPENPDQALAFRQLMGRFATGVAVVAFVPQAGGISAMTINSLVSISLEPMLVSWSLQNASTQYAAYAGAQRFAFSILADDQQALARRYAARGDAALRHEDFALSEGGLPVIKGALGHIGCERFAAHAAGDHTLILGAVTHMATNPAARRPLVFFGGRFGELADHA